MKPMKTFMNGEYEIYDVVSRGRSVPVVTTGTGDAYEATVEGIDKLEAGISFKMMPHTESTSSTPTLNVNGLGARTIVPRLASEETRNHINNYEGPENWISANFPVEVVFDGVLWFADMVVSNARALNGKVPIANGGTGVGTREEALKALGIHWGEEDPEEYWGKISNASEKKKNTIYIQIAKQN